MIIYPPNFHITDSETIFFIGSAKEFCLINGSPVNLINAGNFCPVFPLKLGENDFKIELDNEVFNYKVTFNPASKREEDSFVQASELLKHKLDTILLAAGNIKRICLDPGHGGSAIGTCSPKGFAEKDLNLSLALKLKDKLLNSGYQVLVTREADIDLNLRKRVKLARDFSSDLFLSLHHNAVADNLDPLDFRGISCHYYYDELASYASNLAKNISEFAGLESRGAIKQNLHVLRENDFCPAFLIEFGYLIHPIESELISSKEFQDLLSVNIKPELLFSS